MAIGWNLPTQYIDRQTGATEPIPATDARGMIDWLSARDPGVIGPVTQVTFDGLAGYEFDVRADAVFGCPAVLPSCSTTLPPGPWVAHGLAVDVEGRVVTFWAVAHDPEGLAEARRQLERVHFG
jgi:hypothetical protein